MTNDNDDLRDEPLVDEERLPWLEPIEQDVDGEGPSLGKLIASVLVGVLAIGLVVGGLFWLRDGGGSAGGASGEPEVIAAAEGDYKVKPDDPGGMKVEGEGDTAFATSAGVDPKGRIDTGKVAETPVAKGQPAPAPAPAAQPKTATAAAAPPAATTGAGSIQLGAFSSSAAANNAWNALSGRFAYLKPLSHSVQQAQSGGKTVYRLRAGGPGAAEVCGKLRAAGESCIG